MADSPIPESHHDIPVIPESRKGKFTGDGVQSAAPSRLLNRIVLSLSKPSTFSASAPPDRGPCTAPSSKTSSGSSSDTTAGSTPQASSACYSAAEPARRRRRTTASCIGL